MEKIEILLTIVGFIVLFICAIITSPEYSTLITVLNIGVVMIIMISSIMLIVLLSMTAIIIRKVYCYLRHEEIEESDKWNMYFDYLQIIIFILISLMMFSLSFFVSDFKKDVVVLFGIIHTTVLYAIIVGVSLPLLYAITKYVSIKMKSK